MSTPIRAWLAALPIALACATLSRAAAADLAPPPRYEESCTTGRQARAGEQCESCLADFRDVGRCARTHSTRGLELRCRTRGGSAWSEVWCGPMGDASPPPTASAAAAPVASTGAPAASPPSTAAAPASSSGGGSDSSGCSLRAGRPAALGLPTGLLWAIGWLGRRGTCSRRPRPSDGQPKPEPRSATLSKKCSGAESTTNCERCGVPPPIEMAFVQQHGDALRDAKRWFMQPSRKTTAAVGTATRPTDRPPGP